MFGSEAQGALTSGERLLIRTVRLIALDAVCCAHRAAFEEACGCAGAEAWRALEVFLAELALHGRRRVRLSVPTDGRLTADERVLVDAFAAAQADDYRTLDERLTGLTRAEPPAALGAAACLVAQAMGMGGLVLRPQCCAASTTPRSTAAQWAAAAATT